MEPPGGPVRLPNFVITRGGRPLALGGKRARPLLLHIWASWCGPCRAELPSLLEFGKKGPAEVLAVSVDDDYNAAVRFFGGQVPAEVAWDGKIVLEPGLGVRTLPATFLVDPDGVLRFRWDGMQPWTEDSARFIRDLLRAPSGRQETSPVRR